MRTLLFIFALAYTAIGQIPKCPGDYIAVGTGCYTFPDTYQYTWIQSSLYCQYSGGYLAKIDNETEQWALYDYHDVYYDHVLYRWIGATDMLATGEWRWAPSGETVVYNGWDTSSEPELDCGYWKTEKKFYDQWFTADCYTKTGIKPLCEADPL